MTHVIDLTYSVLAYLAGVWTDISADVITGSVSGSDGFSTNSPIERVATTGEFSFQLKNLTGKYSPGHVSALTGWMVGIPVKVVFTYRGQNYPIFGRIATPGGIQIDPRQKGMPTVSVTCLDWFDLASKHPIVNPGVLTNKRADEVITQTLSYMPIAPQALSLDTGVFTFPTVFDTVTSKTKAYSELAKSALSELGYVYMRHDKTYGETLVFENYQRRNGLRVETPYPAPDDGAELREDGGYEFREDGGYELREDETIAFDGDNTFISADISHGDNLLNRLGCYAYPRRVDTSPVILFRLSQPIAIASGQTIELKGNYTDPLGGSPVSGQSMITPAATTDYLLNTAQNGSGTNITANLSVSASYGTEGFTHQLTNTSTSTGWVTQFNCRGYGIYTYNPIEHVASEADSILSFGVTGDILHQKYQQNLDVATLFSNSICFIEKNPKTRMDKVYFVANYSPAMMGAFLNLGTGDMIRLKSDQANVDAYHFIQGREWKIEKGNIIMFSWIVKEFINLVLGLSLINVSFNQASPYKDAIDYGYDPNLSKIATTSPLFSVSVWVYPTSDIDPANPGHIIGNFSDPSGWRVGIRNGLKVQLYQKGTGAPGVWDTAAGALTLNTWSHIVVTRDTSTSTNAPIIYINGVVKTLTNTNVQGGSIADETGNHLMIGNVKTATVDHQYPFIGTITNYKIFQRILSPTEVAAIYAAGRGSKTMESGIQFFGQSVKTRNISEYIGTLGASNKVFDAIYKNIGTINGSPVGSANP